MNGFVINDVLTGNHVVSGVYAPRLGLQPFDVKVTGSKDHLVQSLAGLVFGIELKAQSIFEEEEEDGDDDESNPRGGAEIDPGENNEANAAATKGNDRAVLQGFHTHDVHLSFFKHPTAPLECTVSLPSPSATSSSGSRDGSTDQVHARECTLRLGELLARELCCNFVLHFGDAYAAQSRSNKAKSFKKEFLPVAKRSIAAAVEAFVSTSIVSSGEAKAAMNASSHGRRVVREPCFVALQSTDLLQECGKLVEEGKDDDEIETAVESMAQRTIESGVALVAVPKKGKDSNNDNDRKIYDETKEALVRYICNATMSSTTSSANENGSKAAFGAVPETMSLSAQTPQGGLHLVRIGDTFFVWLANERRPSATAATILPSALQMLHKMLKFCYENSISFGEYQ